MIFSTKVNGIPCQCRITHYLPAVPMRVYGPGMGDAEPPEPSELEFELLDRKGRYAAWLERYITPEVEKQIAEECHLMLQGENYDYTD